MLLDEILMTSHQLELQFRYVRFAVSPPTKDPLTLRKAFQDALIQTLGITSAGTYMDVLWVAGNGAEVIVRVRDEHVLIFQSSYISFVTQKITVTLQR